MIGVGSDLFGVLEPVRDLAVGQLLQEIAAALGRGASVRHEPMVRDDAGRVVRDGALHLPRRGDLEVTEDGRILMQRVRTRSRLDFEPVTIERPDGFSAVVGPFRWDAARLLVESDEETLSWTPIRRWFLEAFQSRYGELAPDLDGAAHALVGPRQVPQGAEFEIDFGSAPVAVFPDMLDAFALSGARRVVVGVAGHTQPTHGAD